jgi:chromate transporter
VNPELSEAAKVWGRIGLLSFGGPAGQIALIHRETVDQRKWVSEEEFLSALNFCMLLPGPEAMQLATYIGWRMNGLRGGLIAGLLFVVPGALTIFALSVLYSLFGNVPLMAALFWGIKDAVLVIVLEALLRVAKKALKRNSDWVIAGLAFVALFAFGLPFPLVIAIAGVFGFLVPDKSTLVQPTVTLPAFKQTLKTICLWGLIWLVPLGLMRLILGPSNVYFGLGWFFSKLAVVTFGGAYAVLSYMGQDVVEAHHWLSTAQMVDGLGLAETTPGPLILVGQFVGFLAAAQSTGNIWAGVWGSLIFLWMTFVPCFLWIFAGAPYVLYLQGQPRMASALSRIAAAVAGVILNLALWFGLHVMFSGVARLQGFVPLWWPDVSSFDSASLIVTLAAAVALLHFKIGVPKTLAMAALMGVIWKLVLV